MQLSFYWRRLLLSYLLFSLVACNLATRAHDTHSNGSVYLDAFISLDVSFYVPSNVIQILMEEYHLFEEASNQQARLHDI